MVFFRSSLRDHQGSHSASSVGPIGESISRLSPGKKRRGPGQPQRGIVGLKVTLRSALRCSVVGCQRCCIAGGCGLMEGNINDRPQPVPRPTAGAPVSDPFDPHFPAPALGPACATGGYR
ncbi:hypothetical protein AAFF_G00399490 [Aldrovandia affinis]|uniref:Uncharacterized protein n=1 Tax=Aldrovandia affinis TaxID=143900 RepID=A0AAD7SCW3_9TELE|nr:hypothetical protein AAFF_G00399490 [Aldrovandia affinis]